MTLTDRKQKLGLCIVPYCRNHAAPGRKKCHRCIKKAWYQKYPLKYRYNNLRTNAKRRGKEFNMTFDEFCQWAISTQYVFKTKKAKNGMSIDRIDNSKGYDLENIQMLTLSENSIKQNHIDYVPF